MLRPKHSRYQYMANRWDCAHAGIELRLPASMRQVRTLPDHLLGVGASKSVRACLTRLRAPCMHAVGSRGSP
eukprot:7271540-Alexandrium_andersonii.AAC.1